MWHRRTWLSQNLRFHILHGKLLGGNSAPRAQNGTECQLTSGLCIGTGIGTDFGITSGDLSELHIARTAILGAVADERGPGPVFASRLARCEVGHAETGGVEEDRV